MDSFSVCIMARETPDVLHKIIDHYVGMGAETVYLFIDGPARDTADDPEALQPRAGVRLQHCDAAYWAEACDTARPSLEEKQGIVYRDAIRQNVSDWLLFCDADEFLVGHGAFGAALAQVPAEVPGLRIHNTEAVWTGQDDPHKPFDCSHERLPFPGHPVGRFLLPVLIYGTYARILWRGTSGHVQGKHLLRRGVSPRSINPHESVVGDARLPFLHTLRPGSADWRVVHYDAISLDRWREKWRVRLEGETIAARMAGARRSQMAWIGKAIRKGQAERVFRRLNALNRWQVIALRALGLLRPVGIRPDLSTVPVNARPATARPSYSAATAPAAGPSR